MQEEAEEEVGRREERLHLQVVQGEGEGPAPLVGVGVQRQCLWVVSEPAAGEEQSPLEAMGQVVVIVAWGPLLGAGMWAVVGGC